MSDAAGPATPVAPETRADLEPYLAELAGLRPADTTSVPRRGVDNEEDADRTRDDTDAGVDEGGER